MKDRSKNCPDLGLCCTNRVTGVLRLKLQVQHLTPTGHRMLRWTDKASTSAARNVA